MTKASSHRTLLAALVIAGWLIGAAGLFAVFVLNHSRDDQIERVQAEEAWARYDSVVAACSRGNILRVLINAETDADLPILACVDTVPRPTVPRPKE